LPAGICPVSRLSKFEYPNQINKLPAGRMGMPFRSMFHIRALKVQRIRLFGWHIQESEASISIGNHNF
jgi:hypothetical protein